LGFFLPKGWKLIRLRVYRIIQRIWHESGSRRIIGSKVCSVKDKN